jgi:hypothetical protein
VVSVPIGIASAKKSTRVMLPLLPGAALAVTVTGDPTTALAKEIGEVIEIVGSEMLLTVTLIAVESAVLPRLSVTFA